MSLYNDPAYFKGRAIQLSAAGDAVQNVTDLDAAFKAVLDPEAFDELDILRKKPVLGESSTQGLD